jgi:hypothetical protein
MANKPPTYKSPKAQAQQQSAPAQPQTMEPAQSSPGMNTASLPAQHPAPTMPTDSGVSSIMQGSLPPAASGADVYTRQFYGGAPLPKRRFLPVGLVP